MQLKFAFLGLLFAASQVAAARPQSEDGADTPEDGVNTLEDDVNVLADSGDKMGRGQCSLVAPGCQNCNWGSPCSARGCSIYYDCRSNCKCKRRN